MTIFALSGGLGNQMFEYANYLSQKIEQNRYVYINSYCIKRHKEHNGYELSKVFHILDDSVCIHDFIMRVVRKLLIFKDKNNYKNIVSVILKIMNLFGIHIIYENPHLSFDERKSYRKKGLNIYFGSCVSEKFFKSNEAVIRETFLFDETILNETSKNISNKILQTESVSIHIRRGDYLLEKGKINFNNICTSDYYKKALRYISTKIFDPSFFVFSDDIEWTKDNLGISNAVYIEHNKGTDSWQDMFLMSKCKHHIVANSTFGWWGAWLDENKDKIIVAPSRYCVPDVPDIFPDEWIKIKI